MSARSNPALPSTPLRRWRKLSGTSYAELARKTGLALRTVLRVAAGHPPSADTARRISRATGISLDELVGEALPPAPRLSRVAVLETPANRVVALSRPVRAYRGAV